MTDLSWIAPTILALGSLVASVVAAVIALRTSKTVAEVKKATDGMTTALVNNAAEKGRAEGAAIATAGAAASKPKVKK